jgi:hypothetical protein
MHVPEGANNRVKALRRLFAWAIDEEVLDGLENPTRDVAYLKGEPGGFHSWWVRVPPAEGSSHRCSHIQQRAYLVESLEVKGAVGRVTGQIRTGRQATWQAAANG